MRSSTERGFPCGLSIHIQVSCSEQEIESVRITHSAARGSLVCEVLHPAKNSPLIAQIFSWVESYASKRPSKEKLPLKLPEAGPFSLRTLKEIERIPFGKQKSYREVAEKVGSPRAARAVGNACHGNPTPLFIPCHRVVKSDGSLGGFALDIKLKEMLLSFERN
ncbi:MAG: methylated-DNA--[protein]-cysteine S-methyltransferase [Chlamydiales bacterium]|nr:methylated-DNA--[protein]-cysteine S-methyltransferase [Chlamydiales bacterium]